MGKPGASWPMANYLEAWKTFRSLGNEPDATASHVTSLTTWPSRDRLRILDIGCGDGGMIAAFVQRIRSASMAILLDPEDGMLSEAAQRLENIRCEVDIISRVGSADEEGIILAQDADVGLAIHVVYLLPHARFRAFVQNWPSGIPLFVVLDAPNSVFAELWQQSAQDYAARSARVHQYLADEANHGLTVRRTDFSTRVANPFELETAVRSLVLSLLCYCDYDQLPRGKKIEVEQLIRKHAEGSEIVCACTCYELLRGTGVLNQIGDES